jgi:hypothetical protein
LASFDSVAERLTTVSVSSRTARWRRQPAPLEAQKAYLDAHFHRCGEDGSPFLSVPRFQNTRDLLYTGWAPLRMCEAMGGDDARVVAILTNPIDHARVRLRGDAARAPARGAEMGDACKNKKRV